MVRIFPLHLHISIIQRSRGNSARRRIDYQMCQDHHSDEGSVLAYGNKRREHCGTAILGPSHACHVFPSPSAFRRAHMAAEKRGDAQEGVAIDFCLPREIPDNLRLEAAAFALAPLVEAGMVGQIDIHRARATDGGGNPHAHVLFSQRKVTPQGFGSKERSWEKLFRRDNSRWLRTLIASRLNRYCAAKAIDAAVDPRSNKARGTVSPEPRLPRRNWVEHRRGKTTEGLAKLKSLRVELRKARLEVNETENELQTLIDDAPVALIQQLRLRTIAPAYYLRKERGDLQREVAACLAVVEAQGWPLRSVRGGRCALEIDIGVARLRLVRGRIRLCGSLTVQGMEALAALIAALRWGHVNVIGDSSFRHAFELASLSHQAESILLPMQHGPARALLAEQDALEMRTIVAGIDLFGDVALSAAKPAPYRWVEAPRPHAGIRSRAETGTTQPDAPGSRDLRWPVTEV